MTDRLLIKGGYVLSQDPAIGEQAVNLGLMRPQRPVIEADVMVGIPADPVPKAIAVVHAQCPD